MAVGKGMTKTEGTLPERPAKSSVRIALPLRTALRSALKELTGEVYILVEKEPDDDKLEKEIRAAFSHVERVRARAQKRQVEIDKLKKETRALIKKLQAA